jgi:hypothetical protein
MGIPASSAALDASVIQVSLDFTPWDEITLGTTLAGQ